MKIKFHKSGLHTTIQDIGRYGCQTKGIPTSGAMDQESYTLANKLLQQKENTPALEITLIGPKIEFTANCEIAITGANISPKIDNEQVKINQVLKIGAGSILSFGSVVNGCRSYIGIRGNWKLEKWLNSFSSYSMNELILPEKSKIAKGDELEIEQQTQEQKLKFSNFRVKPFDSDISIEVIKGPEFDQFSDTLKQQFFMKKFTISGDSSRMAYTLNEKFNDYTIEKEMISSGSRNNSSSQ